MQVEAAAANVVTNYARTEALVAALECAFPDIVIDGYRPRQKSNGTVQDGHVSEPLTVLDSGTGQPIPNEVIPAADPDASNYILRDWGHPNAEGHRLMFEAVVNMDIPADLGYAAQ